MRQNQTVILGQQANSTAAIDITYTLLLALRDASSFSPGAMYRITDFQTLHLIPYTTDRNDTNITIPIEVLIVQAVSVNRLLNRAYSETFPMDIIHYDINNNSWKELLATGAKGCITLRIDPDRNIEVGNGDWRNFIVRRWAVDLTLTHTYSRGIRWCLWKSSTNCSITNTCNTQTFIAISTTYYDASTNPYGFKDVRMFTIEADGVRSVENVRIKRNQPGTRQSFPMPNLYVETTTATPNIVNNFNCEDVQNVTLTNEVYSLNVARLAECIFTDTLSYANNMIGMIDSCFMAKFIFAEGEIGNIYNVTLYEDVTSFHGTQGMTIKNLNNSFVRLIQGTQTFYRMPGIIIENVQRGLISIQKGYANSYELRGFSFSSIVNTDHWSGLKDLSAFTSNLKFSKEYSNIEITIAAALNIFLSSSQLGPFLDMFAGILNLTGVGAVIIGTLTRYLPNCFIVVLKPIAGLTITIPQNNVADGFIQAASITANGSNNEIIKLTPNGDRWSASN